MEQRHRRISELLHSSRLPLWLKLLPSVWVAVLLPTYWQSTPLELLWFCNVALVVTCAGLWLESSLLISMAALCIVWWQFLWVLDFLIHLATGISTIGMSNYMFDERFNRFSRGLSLYHGWLPFVLVWALWRLKYDGRALFFQTVLAWAVFLLSAILTTGLTGPAGNLNMIYGLSETTPQTWMPPRLWLALVMVSWPASVYVPCHFILRQAFGQRSEAAEHLR